MMSSLYSSVTGLKSHSTGMSVIGNNLSNLSTVAYKQSSVLYADIMSQQMTSAAGNATNVSQVGSGATVNSIRTIFSQGGFESSSSATDIAINGMGFFAVSDGNNTAYTRAGNFSLTSAGTLVDSQGWSLTGYSITNGVTSKSTSDVSIAGADSMAGKGTTSITACSQLGGLTDASSDAANPFFAMASSWDGTASQPLPSGQYSYKESIRFYDNNGELQNATIYYDLAGTDSGKTAIEYVVALDPSADGSSLAGTEGAGLLMAGTMTFSSSGELQNLTAFTPPSNGDPSDLSGWTPAALNNGAPSFTATIAGAGSQTISLDMGLGLSGSSSANAANAAALNAESVYSANPNATLKPSASNAYGSSTGTVTTSVDGYAPGSLTSISIATDGTLSGNYSNGQSMDLYQIPLYRFTSEEGLESLGGNHYAATTDSGAAEEGIAGTENFGTVSECTLEQSNVDMATEFTNLIINQRGFQMNSKVVSTCDQLLQKALELKR